MRRLTSGFRGSMWVGAAMAVALALIIRIKEAYDTVEEDEIHEQDHSL